jgi:GNAT superfamily N-acetyltransferase
MLIRKATAEEMLALWGYGDADIATPTARFFYRNISSGNTVFWTADNDGDLIGELYVFYDLDDKDFADGSSTAYLCAFRVREEFRGQGIGTRMMEEALADLRAAGFLNATIGVDDERNERMYRRMGFNAWVKDCYWDPCAMDDALQPAEDEGFILLSKKL